MSRPLRWSRSATASTGGSAGAVGCVSKPVDAVLRHRELRVVEVVGVYGETVRERGKARGQTHVGADHDAALSARDAERLEVALRDAACLRHGTGERQAQTVENRAPSQVRDVGGISCGRVETTKSATYAVSDDSTGDAAGAVGMVFASFSVNRP